MKPTLLVLAAGMGSRYGGLKQLDQLGPSGQTIMDYSIFDAMRAGFGKVVFVIRKEFEEQFNKQILSKYRDHIPVDVVFQGSEKLPEGYECPVERVRPWGTNHAVLMAKDVINEPFAVINSDDFYGKNAFITLARYLDCLDSVSKGKYCMVAFNLKNTTTENGEVSRGVCTEDGHGKLAKIVECQHIRYNDEGQIVFTDKAGNHNHLEENSPVSMNFWGFTPDYFEYSMRELKRFLDRYINEPSAEFFIPSVVDKLIKTNEAVVDVLRTDSKWFGVTYSEDKDDVREKLRNLHEDGEYPDEMFG